MSKDAQRRLSMILTRILLGDTMDIVIVMNWIVGAFVCFDRRIESLSSIV